MEEENNFLLTDDEEEEPNVDDIVITTPLNMRNLSLIAPLTQESEPTEEHGEGAVANETFNEDLPAIHSYLGENLEEVSGRMIYTELRHTTIPLLAGHYATLLPGQTFPLTVRDLGRCEMLRACMEGDHTFGCISRQPEGDPLFGTTAEIYEYLDENGTVCIKAKGRQRFKIIKIIKSPTCRSYRLAEIMILPEVKLQHPFNALRIGSLNALRITQKEKCRRIESGFMVWPKWVYDMYDPDMLVKRADKITFLKQGLRKEKGQNVMPTDPSELSFWIASHLDGERRWTLLKLNSPISRLRWLLSFLGKNQRYVCSCCEAPVGKQSDIFAMSIEGPQSTFINSAGHHHDTVTLLEADNIIPISSPSTYYSWFPGYAWRIAVCRLCEGHLGWLFIATNSKLWPKKFWGLSRQSIVSQVSFEGMVYDPDEQPVM